MAAGSARAADRGSLNSIGSCSMAAARRLAAGVERTTTQGAQSPTPGDYQWPSAWLHCSGVKRPTPPAGSSTRSRATHPALVAALERGPRGGGRHCDRTAGSQWPPHWRHRCAGGGAGTGKTYALSHRVLRKSARTASIDQILVVTARAAAAEIRRRIPPPGGSLSSSGLPAGQRADHDPSLEELISRWAASAQGVEVLLNLLKR